MRASGWGGRLALLLFGFAAAAVLLELALRAGAWWIAAGDLAPRGRAGFEGGGHRVLCLGDSNTFGLGVDPGDSHPAQLERLWNERAGGPRIQVVNLGRPGANSSSLAADLPGLLDRFTPDTIFVMIGVNDFWTRAEPIDPGAPAPGGVSGTASNLRLARLLAVLRVRLSRPTGAEPLAGGIAAGGSGADGARLLPRHLAVITASARARGVTPVLLTYPSSRSLYAIASRRVRAAGQESGTRVVDVGHVFGDRCPGEVCDLLQPDAHPTAAGHRVVAETLVAERAIEWR